MAKKKKQKEIQESDSSSQVQPQSTDAPRQRQSTYCPAAFGQKPTKHHPACLTCDAEDECYIATHNRSPKCLWNGRYPGPHAPSCTTCTRVDACCTETELDSENEYKFFKDVAVIQACSLLDHHYLSIVRELTGTDIADYMPMPEFLRRSAIDRATNLYDHEYCWLVQSPYEIPWEVIRTAPCVATAQAYTKFSKDLDNIIGRHQKDILHAIATIALSTFDIEDDNFYIF